MGARRYGIRGLLRPSEKWCSLPALALLCLVIFGVAGLPGCTKPSIGSPAGAKSKVRVAKPLIREVTEYVYYTGRLEAVESVNVQSRVTGYLQPVEFHPGSEVKAGQQLFLIDPRPYQATYDEAMGQVKLSEARLELAVADYKRGVEVARTPGAISKQDLDKYLAAQNEAAAEVEASKANSEAAKLNLEFTSIISPIDGRVGRNLLTQGNLVKQDSTLLTTVVSQDPMYAYFDVDEYTMLRVQKMIRDGKIGSVRQGAEMPIDMGLANEGSEYPHPGKVDFVNNRVDPSTGTLQVRGSFPNPLLGEKATRLLSPGLFVRIRFPLGKPFRALLLPQAAVSTDQGLKYLLVVNQAGIVEYRPVTLGPEQPGGLQVILPMKLVRTKKGVQVADEKTPAGAQTFESLSPDEHVVISGLQMVRPGMHVETREVNITPGPKGLLPGSATADGASTDEDAPLAPSTERPVEHATPTESPAKEKESPQQQEPAENSVPAKSPASENATPQPSKSPAAQPDQSTLRILPEQESPQKDSDGVFEAAPDQP
jgi:membrane fusion protein, multidrug efflux system